MSREDLVSIVVSMLRKLKILCLHGYNGSAQVLRRQLAPLASNLESLVELVFIDAPSRAAGDFGWWHAVTTSLAPVVGDPGVDGPRRHYKGWQRTRDAIVAAFGTHGPFDGVLGFSQGAALAGLLVGLCGSSAQPSSEQPLHFDFAIMIGGFASNDTELARLYERRQSYALPSLHVFGRSDAVVPSDESRKLAAHFVNPSLVEHAGGHVIPSERPAQRALYSFLEQRLRDRDGVATSGLGATSSKPRAALEIPLWPGQASPSMRVVFPSGSGPTRALVVFRGGGYSTSRGSGGGAAEWAAKNGLVGVEVDYRSQATGDAFPKNYADAARAVRLVRQCAAQWGVDPSRVGVLGFSAGGHLASLLSTQPELYVDPSDDLAASVSARPDFVILAYPLVSFVAGYEPRAFVGSVENFFGQRRPDVASRRAFSNELHMTASHPPAFVWTTADDQLVPAEHARLFAAACERAGVPVTLHVFPHGAHGMGLALGEPSEVGSWTKQALAWLARLP